MNLKHNNHNNGYSDDINHTGPVDDGAINRCVDIEYHDILEMVDDHVSLVDRDLTLIWANKTAKGLFGDDMVGKHCCEVYHKSSPPCDETAPCLARQVLSEGKIQRHDIKLINRFGKEVYCQGKAQVVARHSDGTPRIIAKIYKDVTDRKVAAAELEDSMQKLQKNLVGTIEAMSRTVETRDPYTAGHQKRTAEIAKEIAQLMGLSANQVNGIVMAGAIHDIGKICIPSGILSKPGKISRSEFSLIKDHPESGYNILKDIDFNTPVADIVLQHHERLNGSGYPFGLAGDDILIEARVIGVADVIEAMASHRPYRPALGVDIALDEIRQNRGIFYDPVVVDAAMDLFSQDCMQFHQA